MPEIGRWVPKNQAMDEMGISLSTLDRMIKDGRVESTRQDGRVYVVVYGPQPVTDRERLEYVQEALAESERTVANLERVRSGLRRRVSKLNENVESLNLDVQNTQDIEFILRAERDRLKADLCAGRRRTQKIIFLCVSVIVVLLLALAVTLTQ